MFKPRQLLFGPASHKATTVDGFSCIGVKERSGRKAFFILAYFQHICIINDSELCGGK